MAKGSIVNKKYQPSEDLAEFLGSGRPVKRGDVIKKVWDYASRHDLKTQKKYKTKNGMRNMGAIDPDEDLEPILGRKIVAAPEIMKLVSQHLD